MANNLKYVAFIEKLRAESKKSLHEAALRWNHLANKCSSDLSKRLFTITSLILPLSLIPLTNQEIISNLTLLSKIILILSWLFFIVSLVCGIIYIRKEAEFFNGWAEQENERSNVYSQAIFTNSAIQAYQRLNLMERKSAKLVRMANESDKRFLNWQQAMLVIGIFLIGLVLTLKLFKTNPNYLNHFNKPHYMKNYREQLKFYKN